MCLIPVTQAHLDGMEIDKNGYRGDARGLVGATALGWGVPAPFPSGRSNISPLFRNVRESRRLAELLKRSVSNHARSTRVGSNPVVGTTSQQPTQPSILPRSVNEYSEVILRAQAVMPQAHISCIAAIYPACVNK